MLLQSAHGFSAPVGSKCVAWCHVQTVAIRDVLLILATGALQRQRSVHRFVVDVFGRSEAEQTLAVDAHLVGLAFRAHGGRHVLRLHFAVAPVDLETSDARTCRQDISLKL